MESYCACCSRVMAPQQLMDFPWKQHFEDSSLWWDYGDSRVCPAAQVLEHKTSEDFFWSNPLDREKLTEKGLALTAGRRKALCGEGKDKQGNP
eukprot:c9825_g1_i1 orf=98-376(-)